MEPVRDNQKEFLKLLWDGHWTCDLTRVVAKCESWQYSLVKEIFPKFHTHTRRQSKATTTTETSLNFDLGKSLPS